MCQLLETIKCAEGKLENLDYHQARFSLSRKIKFSAEDEISLKNQIQIPDFAKTGLLRCRVIYGKQIDRIEFVPHVYRSVTTLRVVECDDIDYQFKYSDRKKLEAVFEKRDECDDIIIVKNGWVTDSFAANLVFFDGEKWVTPDKPLLAGTQRARLLSEGQITSAGVTKYDLKNFQKAGLINAMNNLENMPVIEISKIVF